MDSVTAPGGFVQSHFKMLCKGIKTLTLMDASIQKD